MGFRLLTTLFSASFWALAFCATANADTCTPTKKSNALIRKLETAGRLSVLPPEWKEYDLKTTRQLRSQIKKNYGLYLDAKRRGHPHILALEKYFGFHFGPSVDDLIVPKTSEIMRSFERHMDDFVATGVIPETQRLRGARVFALGTETLLLPTKEMNLISLKSFNVPRRGHLVKITKEHPRFEELYAQWLKEKGKKSQDDHFSREDFAGTFAYEYPSKFAYVEFGKPIPEGAVPWDELLSEGDFMEMIAAGYYPLGEVLSLARKKKKKEFSPLWHDLSHFTLFLERPSIMGTQKMAAAALDPQWLRQGILTPLIGFSTANMSLSRRMIFAFEYISHLSEPTAGMKWKEVLDLPALHPSSL